MTTIIAFAVILIAFASMFLAGFAIGRDSKTGSVWANGYVAGLDKADDMFPAVRRWEMTDE
jgi:hypothetical protein